MKPLSESQASKCENATTARCRCRCRGVLHGARRASVGDLPAGDPHSPRAKPDELVEELAIDDGQMTLPGFELPATPSDWLNAIRDGLPDRPSRRSGYGWTAMAETTSRRSDGPTEVVA